MNPAERDQRIAAAVEVVGYDGPVHWFGDDAPDISTAGEDWWENVGSFLECWQDSPMSRDEDADGNEIDLQPVEFVFCGKMKQLKLDLEASWDSLADAGYEDMMECVAGEKELFAAVDAFNKLNQKALQVWQPDYTKKVRVPRI